MLGAAGAGPGARCASGHRRKGAPWALASWGGGTHRRDRFLYSYSQQPGSAGRQGGARVPGRQEVEETCAESEFEM